MYNLENVGIATLVSGTLSFALYYIISQVRERNLGIMHYVGLGILFILLSYQSFKFMEAWNERIAIEQTLEGINDWTNGVADFVDEFDKQNGGNGETSKHIKDALNNPLVQKGLNLFGLKTEVSGGMTLEMAEKLKTKYNWYMFRRTCWMFGFIIIYIICAMNIHGCQAFGSRKPSVSTNRISHRPSSRINGKYTKRHLNR